MDSRQPLITLMTVAYTISGGGRITISSQDDDWRIFSIFKEIHCVQGN